MLLVLVCSWTSTAAKVMAGLEIATDTGNHLSNIFFLVTQNSGLVANLASRFLYVLGVKFKSMSSAWFTNFPHVLSTSCVGYYIGEPLTPFFYDSITIRKSNTLWFLPQLVVAVGLSLNVANLIGYVRCKKDAGKNIKSFAGNFLGRQLLNQVIFWLVQFGM